MIQKLHSILSFYFSSEMLLKSIDQINGVDEPLDLQTDLTRRATEARRKPIGELTTRELCTLLRQGEGGTITLSLGMFIATEEPMISADNGSGDLLELLLEYDWKDWKKTVQYGNDPWGFISRVESTISGLRDSLEEMEKRCAKVDAACDLDTDFD